MEQNIQDTHNQYSASEKEVVHQPEPPHLAAIIESLLFVSGHPLEMVELRKILAINDEQLAAALELLARDLAHARRGIRLQSMGTQVQLVTAPENARYVALLLGLPLTARLTTAALETLAVVAYRQPLTRSQIEAVRGVNSDRALTSLIQHGLVSEIGRAPTPGRPALFATTGDFLQQFGLTSLSELPGVTNRIAQRSDQGVSQDQQSVPAISQ